MINDFPLPASPAVSVIPITYADNHIPLDFDQIQLLINGPDLIIKSGDDKQLILPLGAKLASLNQHLFTLSFSDGTVISSDDLLRQAKVEIEAPGMNRAGKDLKGEPTTEPQVVIKEVINQVIIDENIGGAVDEAESDEITITQIDSALPLPDKQPVTELLVRSTSSGTPPEPLGQAASAGESSHPPVTPPDTEGNGVVAMPLTLTQVAGVADMLNHFWQGGTGNLAATKSGDWATQYVATNIDLSAESSNWTIQVNNNQVIPEGMVARVIRLDKSSGDISVTGLPAGYVLITADSAEGKFYNLQPNELMLIYPQGHKASFELSFTYTSLSGTQIKESAKFVIVDNPTTNIDSDGRFQLSTMMNDVNVLGGSGDDHIIAGHQYGIYDGGAGHNTVDYSASSQALVIDLTKGETTIASNGTKQHSLINIQEVVGSDYGDTLIGNSVDNVLRGGAGDDLLIGGAGNNRLDGGSGINTVSYAASTTGVSVDLSGGVTSNNGLGGQDTLLNIQNIIGSSQDDVLIGNHQNNHIQAGNGDDTLMGMGGDNYLDGGAGINTVSYEHDIAGVHVDLSTGVAQNGFGGTDTLINIQQIIGSSFNDVLLSGRGYSYIRGGGGNDTLIINGDMASRAILEGGLGDDMFIAGNGVNKFIGGGGFDKVDYSQARSGIDANLKTGQVYDNGFGGMDTLEEISAIIGTQFADRFILGNGNHHISAGGGDDTIIAGSGNNHIDGGSGFNTVDYSAAVSAINVDLLSGVASSNGFGGQDNLTNVNQIIGTAFNDVIAGGNGDDVIYAGDGDDIILGSLGSDTLFGGEGNNKLDYSRLSAGVTIDVINGRTIKSVGGTDSFSHFTQFIGSLDNDVFIMSKGNFTIDGGAGVDTVDYSQISARIVVDLRSGRAYQFDAANADFGVQYLSSIEKIILPNSVSGRGSVVYTGTSGGLWVMGSDGADTFYVMGGSNTFTGGGGTDWISYIHAKSGVNVRVDANNNGKATNNGYGGQDILNGIAYIQGSSHDDYLAGNNLLNGRKGNDTLEGTGSGAIAYYRESPRGIVADLEAGIVSDDGYGYQDKLININKIYGSDSGDIIYGNSQDNVISTYEGNDLIFGSKGNDFLNGGSGIDTVDYSLLDAGILANLSTKIVNKGVNGKDNLASIENLTGTIFDDVLIGDAGNNILVGGGGNDILIGGGGDDLLFGGNGFVTASYQTSTSGIHANLSTGVVADGLDGTDTLVQINKILGSSHDDIFTITSSSDLQNYVIDGGAGIDTLKKVGSGQTFNLTGPDFQISNIERFDFADKAADDITVDLNALFAGQAATSSIFMNTDAADVVHLSGSGWSMVASDANSETWANGNQTFSHTWA
ncbi:beta strand repeat-containing protein [Pragia fontium]|uniref:beta strand repeat-containing protein n=1 Tax=Pragia fontium TaxID=82985 RepID=UPI000F6D747F|nr:calcium-binding protein [Pragia fontium]VEJ54444.1 Cyclolysin [Pragia fontium]